MTLQRISWEVVEEVGHLGLGLGQNSSLTVLDRPTLEELRTVVKDLAQNDRYRSLQGLIIFSHRPGCFVAGADIKLINSLTTPSAAASGSEQGQEIYNMIEDLDIPSVACIDGLCLGGGLELALACRHILASDNPKTQLGLPEVKLGILPAWGGTYRLPPRVGLATSLDLILSGKMISARKAYSLKLVDEIYPAERLLEYAPKFFKKPRFFRSKSSLSQSLESMACENTLGRKMVFKKARTNVLEKTKGHYHAPLRILDVMEEGMGKGRASYLSLESEAFGELCAGVQGQNLQHVFFLQDASKKWPGEAAKVRPPKVSRGAVVGAGTMGGGIAWLFANYGQQPIMKDITLPALELGLKQASSNFRQALKRRKISQEDFQRLQRSIAAQTTHQGFGRVDLVVEAVVENLEVKQKVLAEIEKNVSQECLVTTNTSSLSVEKLAGGMATPQRFAGLHFFNPVHRMPLVEIITHSQVAPETVERLYRWCLAVKKTPVVVKDGPGFLVNRMLMPYLNEALYLLDQGVSVEAVDRACLNFGLPMGPCRLMDEVGLDVLEKVAQILYQGLGERAKPCPLGAKFVAKNWWGRKTQKGIYHYDQNGKKIGDNPERDSLLPYKRVEMGEEEIQMRVLLPMINEAGNILEEGIVESAAKVDLGLIFGMGFPPFRGGPLRYADSEGPAQILNALEKFSNDVSSQRYTPSSHLCRLVESGQKFYS